MDTKGKNTSEIKTFMAPSPTSKRMNEDVE